MDIKNQEGLEIFLGFKCNVNCKFCYQKDLRFTYKHNIESATVYSMLHKGFKEGKKFIIFSGGEPTLDFNLPKYVEYANKLGYEHIRIHTNGFRFQKKEYLFDLYNKGLTGITISVHGYGYVHDKVTGVSGSFKIIQKALINFEKLKRVHPEFVIDTNTVIYKDNYFNLPKLIKFLSYFSVTRGQLVLTYSLELFNYNEKLEIIPRYNEITSTLMKTIDLARVKQKKFVIENIPFCVIDRDYWDAITENIKIEKDSITINEGNAGNTNLKWIYKSDKCLNCIKNDVCRGIPIDYYKVYGDSELKSIN